MTAGATALGRPIAEIEEERHLWTPREGWSSLLLLLAMIGITAVAIDDANWVGAAADGGRATGFLLQMALVSVALGFLLAKSPVPTAVGHLIGAATGAAWILISVAGAISAAPTLLGRLRALNASTEIFYHDVVVVGIRSSEISIFLLGVGTLVWAMGQFAAFSVFRHQRAMPAVVGIGLGLLINMSITIRIQFPHLIVFSAAALLLMIRLNLIRQVTQWQARRIGDSGFVSGRFLRNGLWYVTLCVIGAILLSFNASSAPLANAWRDLDDHLLTVGIEANRWIGGVTGAARGPSGLFAPTQTIRGVWESSTERVFRARTTDDRAVYWRGATYDLFDGRTWQQLEPTRVDIPAGQELLAGTADSAAGDPARIEVHAAVTSLALAGGTLLAPETPVLLDRDAEVVTHGEGGPFAVIDLRDAVDPGDTYTVTALVPDLDPASDAAVTGAELAAAGVGYPSWTRRFVEIRPGSIGPRVFETVEAIVDELPPSRRDPFHIAEAVQEYLYRSGDFTYNTNIAGLCGREKVVDCFLRIRQGYCEQFATTMVMLLRTQQIPARVALGFLPGRQMDDGSWEVARAAAHAWVEVYFPDYGWIRFDPTPGNDENGQTPTVLAPGDDPAGPDRPLPAPSFGPDPGLVDPRRPELLEPPEGSEPPPPTPVRPSSGPLGLLAVVVLVAVVGALALFARYRRLPAPQPDLAYRGVARLAARFGYGPRASDTAYEYASTLGAVVPHVRDEIGVVARAKVESTYGRRTPDATVLEQLRVAYRRIRVAILRLAFRRPRRRRAKSR